MKAKLNSNEFRCCPPDFMDQEDGSVEIPGQWRREIGDVQVMVH